MRVCIQVGTDDLSVYEVQSVESIEYITLGDTDYDLRNTLILQGTVGSKTFEHLLHFSSTNKLNNFVECLTEQGRIRINVEADDVVFYTDAYDDIDIDNIKSWV